MEYPEIVPQELVDDAGDTDTEMVTAYTDIPPLAQANNAWELSIVTDPNLEGKDEQRIDEVPVASPSLDLLDRMKNTYRLLDLVSDGGSDGSVDKVVIAQDCLKKFTNHVENGSYRSVTKVDFRTLDKHTIKPRGVYGSLSSLVDFLESLGCVDKETVRLLLASQDEPFGATLPRLRSGLYLLDSRNIDQGLCYIMFWPESSTWKDGTRSAAARNRVTFMRYLTKLCDQIVCLIADNHSEKLVWHDESTTHEVSEHGSEDIDADDRLFTFTVEQTQNQEEGATIEEGFSFEDPCIEGLKELPPGCPTDIPLQLLQPRLVVGQSSQGLLCTNYLLEDMESTQIDHLHDRNTISNMLRTQAMVQIRLESSLDIGSLHLLLELGLGRRCGDAEAKFKARNSVHEQNLAAWRAVELEKVEIFIEDRMKSLDSCFPVWLIQQAVNIYPSMSLEMLLLKVLNRPDGSISAEDISKSIAEVEVIYEHQASAKQNALKKFISSLADLEKNRFGRYTALKQQYWRISNLLKNNPNIPPVAAQQFVDLITKDSLNFSREYNRLVESLTIEENAWTIWSFWKLPHKKIQVNQRNFSALPNDIELWKSLQEDSQRHPAYAKVEEAIRAEATNLVSKVLIKAVPRALKGIRTALFKRENEKVNRMVEEREKEQYQNSRQDLLKDMRSDLEHAFDHTRPCIKVSSIIREGHQKRKLEMFRLRGVETKPKRADLCYRFYPFEIKKEDRQEVGINPLHVCRPFINTRGTQTFSLLKDVQLRDFFLVGKDSHLVILEASGKLEIYFDTLNAIGNSIKHRQPKKKFDLEKVGTESLSALDEGKRLLAILSRKEESLHVYVYAFDESAKALYSRGTPVNITRWYPDGIPSFYKLLFVPGTEELLLVESGGTSRIFSLTTENFRSKTVQLGCTPCAVFVTTDGSCLLVLDEQEASLRMRCFHWASFGEHVGILLTLPSWASSTTPMAVSSIGNRDSVHIILLRPEDSTCASHVIRITQKSSAFAFQHDLNEANRQRNRNSIHNSLIDSHAEVWTRFPIDAPIHQEATSEAIRCLKNIMFISNSMGSFESYFKRMVADFDLSTRKPSQSLKSITISSSSNWDPTTASADVSIFRLGDWLVRMLCLIPIHLAVTSSNRFIPLKDGVASSNFERSLLGANVTQIAQELSFGWYESIFSSYLADKPVKVVTSMGEQSVGKSYTLNHLVDTSFAGSAMRCTEGVWLSVTPTKEYLIVAMDFEGVQSIERSPQEDTLLVLLNTAISNFVLFRNNFAFSRDIAGLFTSFQSCISVLDPASNPSLFQSRLEIIIKDVSASDTDEMVKEFYLKFQRLVEEEGADNFITKLHRGKLGFISWPVIESSRFYTLFNNLRTRFMKQPVTHKHAGTFLILLKTLMAKLKANDWGALDQNLAIQRAEHLSALITNALAFGNSDPFTGEPLKNCEDDQPISSEMDSNILYISSAIHPLTNEPLSIRSCLLELRRGWNHRLRRYSMTEQDYFSAYQAYLEKVASSRVELVHRWLKINTERFVENAEIKDLFRTFENLVKELRMAILPCGAPCSTCNLLCLEQRYHEGKHDCATKHKCPTICGFTDQHEVSKIPSCDMPAGHQGRHFCSTVEHLCGITCHLEDKEGCLRKCSKPMDHEDSEHICAAAVHACGAPCDLIGIDGVPICTRRCITDCRKPHERHCCERTLACPLHCQLCKSYCSAGDHFHALEPGAIHLCGQEHSCQQRCQMPGICEIASTPQSIESSFRGRYSSFQYTKYSQEARKLPCAILIPADQLEHTGSHIHTTDPSPFHFCDARCRYCNYYCTYPLGHAQDEHRTQHGSMEQTEWFIEGEEGTSLELQGRRFASGDSGAPMLCSMLCKAMGRHVHISPCRGDHGTMYPEDGIEHIQGQIGESQYDWVSHQRFWARSGFEDPYTHAERVDFELCDRRCGGEEHDPAINPGAVASYCILPMFHPPANASAAPTRGYTSLDGHVYTCKNPLSMQKSFHIFFAIDSSSSMKNSDRQPLPGTPVTRQIAINANNRYGAVLTALYRFWLARDAATRSATAAGVRRDAYTIITFQSTASVVRRNDMTSTPDALLASLSPVCGGGTSFTHALRTIQTELGNSWTTERSPVVIFLSDGECILGDETIHDLCRTSARLGKPLALHTISFGREQSSEVLRRMVTIARREYSAMPADPLGGRVNNPCSYHEALDTVQLADTFLSIAESLKSPRAALMSR